MNRWFARYGVVLAVLAFVSTPVGSAHGTTTATPAPGTPGGFAATSTPGAGR